MVLRAEVYLKKEQQRSTINEASLGRVLGILIFEITAFGAARERHAGPRRARRADAGLHRPPHREGGEETLPSDAATAPTRSGYESSVKYAFMILN